MTTPALNTPVAIIEDAMLDSGLLEQGNKPDSTQLAKYMGRLQDLINLWQLRGLKLWLQTDQSITLVSGTRDYTLTVNSVKPLRVQQGYYLDANSNRRPIYPLSWDEWLRLSNTATTNTGAITQYFVDKRTTSLVVSFWLTPDATAALGTAHLLTQRQVTDPISLTETMEFPTEWRMALHWGLSAEICTGQPESVITRCETKAAMYLEVLEGWDVEDAPTSFQPDSRFGGQSSFR